MAARSRRRFVSYVHESWLDHTCRAATPLPLPHSLREAGGGRRKNPGPTSVFRLPSSVDLHAAGGAVRWMRSQVHEQWRKTQDGERDEEVDEQGTPGKLEGHERQHQASVRVAPADTRVEEEAGAQHGDLHSRIDRTRPERQPPRRAQGNEPLAAWKHWISERPEDARHPVRRGPQDEGAIGKTKESNHHR